MNDADYTSRLLHLQTAWWKTLFDVQAPYRRNLRRLPLGFVLEIGCGVGRNLLHLGGAGVGTDTNLHSVKACRARGLVAFSPDEFVKSEYARPDRFDSILMSHVAEHMTRPQVVSLLSDYAAYLKRDGRIILITPQERGYRSDPTHVEFMDFAALAAVLASIGFQRERAYSFPFPRWMGRFFIYNEFVIVGRRLPSRTAVPAS